MKRSRLTLCFGLIAVGLAHPAFAQDDQTSTVPSCTVSCKPGSPVAVPSETAVPVSPPAPYVMELSPDEVEPPVPSKIVAARGVVMAETPAERADRKRLYASMLKSIVPVAGRPPRTTPVSH